MWFERNFNLGLHLKAWNLWRDYKP